MCDLTCCSLGDVLVNITSNGSSLNMDEMMTSEGFAADSRCNRYIWAMTALLPIPVLTSEGIQSLGSLREKQYCKFPTVLTTFLFIIIN